MGRRRLKGPGFPAKVQYWVRTPDEPMDNRTIRRCAYCPLMAVTTEYREDRFGGLDMSSRRFTCGGDH
jgi:hypothetical protein